MTAGLGQLVRALQGLSDHVERDPTRYAKWTAPQAEFLACDARRKLFRVGNGGGKSRAALYDVLARARKRHPFRPDWNAKRGPTRQWIVTVSWSQAVPLMHQFRAMLGPDELRQAPRWDDAKGWGKDAPTLIWPDGSSVGWRTMRQGPLMHAGAELDHVLIDEPCRLEHYRELDRRVSRRNGDLTHAMTPINAPEDLQWERDLCADGHLRDLNYPMDERLFRFTDGTVRTLDDGTVCDAAWIAEQVRGVPLQYRDIVVNGGWDEAVVDGVWTEVFSPSRHVSTFQLDGGEQLCLGVDHGTRDFAETAVLVAVDERTEYPAVYVLDVYEAGRNSSSEADAKGILAMLARHKVGWVKPLSGGRLKRATGDIAHYGGRGRVNRKSNQELSYELARQMGLGRHEALSPPLWTAKAGKGASPRGSVFRGNSWLYKAMQREGQLTIDPRCVSLIKALSEYKEGNDDASHLADALRYALDHYVARGQTRNVPPPTLRF